jgi:hypothetical protein
MYDDGYHIWDVKKKTIAHKLAVPLRDVPIVHSGEIVRMQALDGQAPRVVIQVVEPVAELAVFHQDLVVVAALEEQWPFDRRRNCGHGGG